MQHYHLTNDQIQSGSESVENLEEFLDENLTDEAKNANTWKQRTPQELIRIFLTIHCPKDVEQIYNFFMRAPENEPEGARMRYYPNGHDEHNPYQNRRSSAKQRTCYRE